MAQVPVDAAGTKWVETRLIIKPHKVSFDFLNKTQIGATSMSTSSWHYCPDCDFDKRADDADKPFSFLKGNTSTTFATYSAAITASDAGDA